MHRELSRVTNGSAESNEARENASDQAAIRFSFIFDRLKGGREFYLYAFHIRREKRTKQSAQA